MRVFVTVGNALVPFDRLLRMVDDAVDGADVEGVCQHGPSSVRPRGLRPVPGLSKLEFEAEMRAADVVVCHAGVGTLWSAIQEGHRPLVVPRRAALGEIINDHQLEICEALREGDRIELVESAQTLRHWLLMPGPRAQPPKSTQDAAIARVGEAVRLAGRDARGVRFPRLLRALAALGPPLRSLTVRGPGQ